MNVVNGLVVGMGKTVSDKTTFNILDVITVCMVVSSNPAAPGATIPFQAAFLRPVVCPSFLVTASALAA